jgi:hypothetical protein
MLITNYIILMHLLSQNISISVGLIVCGSVFFRLQHIFKNAYLRFDTLLRKFVNRARCSM